MTIKVHYSKTVESALAQFLPQLIEDKVASRIFQKDSSLWGEAAQPEASIRLGWVDAAKKSLALLDELSQLKAELKSKGLDLVVLCGMGGSSLAPEVITKTAGVELVVLDSTEPSQVLDAVSRDLQRTIAVVSSKSGSTVETDSQKRTLEQAFDDAGVNKAERIFIVTDPDSPMHKAALADGYRVFLADPSVGGRYSALTAFGVVPSFLAGVDMKPILDSAINAEAVLSIDSPSNPGLQLATALARTGSKDGYKDKIGFVPGSSPIKDFGDWLEQLIAESTGKEGKGVLPVVIGPKSPEVELGLADLLLVDLSADAFHSTLDVAVSGELGEQLLLWEFATAAASRLLGVNPFDQPDVESAKTAARALLDSPITNSSSQFGDQGIGWSVAGYETNTNNLPLALKELISKLSHDGYLSIHCYLNRFSSAKAQDLRDLFARVSGRPTTFGWGPRFLHSTGQYHKGGPAQGVFLQILSNNEFDVEIPGRPFGYKQLITAQANGDANVLADKGLPVLTVTLDDVDSGVDSLIGIVKAL